jgi:isoleucyl-tRNA synthetase
VATAAGETVALDLTVSDTLRAEGWAREVVRLVQDARTSAGLRVSDRIELRWATSDGDLAAALAAYRELIAGEVLAVTFGPGEGPGDGPGPWHEHADDDLGLRFQLAVSG